MIWSYCRSGASQNQSGCIFKHTRTTPVLLLLVGLVFIMRTTSSSNSPNHSRVARMVNGRPANQREWQFAAWIHKDKNGGSPQYCGASLISDRWVVTAAHCVHDSLATPWLVYVGVGSVSRAVLEQTDRTYAVSKIYLFPGYNNNVMPNDDIALLRLKTAVCNHNNSVKPATFAVWRDHNDAITKMRCKTAGWGKTQSFESLQELLSPLHPPSHQLLEIDVPIINREQCISSFQTIKSVPILGNSSEFWKRMFCGGSSSPSEGTACYHDSGSPLVCEDGEGHTQLEGIAIAIHGPEILTSPCKPGAQVIIFSRLSTYFKWILGTVTQNS